MVYNQGFVSGTTSAADGFGHGTHVSGIIAGNGYIASSVQNYPYVYQGIAPQAKIINLRVLDNSGASTDSSVISAIQQAISLKATYNIRVINLSLSRGVYESYTLDPLCQAVESAWKAGIVVVAAAGNMGEYYAAGTNGYATIGAPGNDPYIITVGATNNQGADSADGNQLQFEGSHGARPHREAGPCGSGECGGIPEVFDQPTSESLSRPGDFSMQLSSVHLRFDLRQRQLHATKRHEHGRSGSQRSRGSASAAESGSHSRPSQSAPDEDGVEGLPAVHERDGSGNRHGLPDGRRRVHGWRRRSGRFRCSCQYRPGATAGWICTVSHRRV